MADYFQDFPFEEHRRPSGDYFRSVQEAKEAGFDEDQIWSVVQSDGTYTYGPIHHFVNLEGFVATTERHNGEDYYHDEPDDDEDEDDEDDY